MKISSITPTVLNPLYFGTDGVIPLKTLLNHFITPRFAFKPFF